MKERKFVKPDTQQLREEGGKGYQHRDTCCHDMEKDGRRKKETGAKKEKGRKSDETKKG